jgi:hypothetical protein
MGLGGRSPVTDILEDAKPESLKRVAEKAAKAAQALMSDKPPAPVERGGVADKLPKQGGAVVISPPPSPAPPGAVIAPKQG